MSTPILPDAARETQPHPSKAHQRTLPVADLRPADVEMARVLKTAPLRIASARPMVPSRIGSTGLCTTWSSP